MGYNLEPGGKRDRGLSGEPEVLGFTMWYRVLSQKVTRSRDPPSEELRNVQWQILSGSKSRSTSGVFCLLV